MEMIVPDRGALSAKAREAERTAAESEKAANLNFMVPSLGPGIELTVPGTRRVRCKATDNLKTTTGCRLVNRRSGLSETESIVDRGAVRAKGEFASRIFV
jgi:hypothetical protein